MNWMFYSILAALFWATATLIDKYVLSKRIKNPNVPVMIFGLIGLAASSLIYFFRGYAALSLQNIAISFFASVGYVLATVFYFKAVKIEEASRISALAYLSPLFVLIFAGLFLDEVFTPEKYLGILLVVGGTVLISSKNLAKLQFGYSLWLMILASISLATNVILTKYLLNFADYWTVFAYTRGVWNFIAIIPVYYFNFADLVGVLKEPGKKSAGIIVLSGSLTMLGALIITLATSLGPATLVSTVSSIRPFFVLFFAVILSRFYPKIIHEELARPELMKKVVAIILMFAGVVLIA